MKKLADKLFVIFAGLFLLGVLAGTVRKVGAETSYYENRALAAMPQLTYETLSHGEYASNVQKFLTDRAFGRTAALKTGTWVKLNLLRQSVVNKVVDAGDVLLQFHGFDTFGTGDVADKAAERGQALGDLSEFISDCGGSFLYVGVPEQYSYFGGSYPDYLDSRQWYLSVIHREFAAALGANDVEFVDMVQAFADMGNPAGLYSATDHHYNYYGMLETYHALMERVNSVTGYALPVLGESDLTLRELPNAFLGSRNRELYALRPMSDRLVIGELNDPIPFTRWDNGHDSAPSVYAMPSYDGDTVTYSVYMGGDVGETRIRTDRPELPSALIFGDSFTNALETVLYASFNETRSLDLRHYTEMSLREYIAEYKPDVVICLCNDTGYLSTEGNGNIS